MIGVSDVEILFGVYLSLLKVGVLVVRFVPKDRRRFDTFSEFSPLFPEPNISFKGVLVDKSVPNDRRRLLPGVKFVEPESDRRRSALVDIFEKILPQSSEEAVFDYVVTGFFLIIKRGVMSIPCKVCTNQFFFLAYML